MTAAKAVILAAGKGTRMRRPDTFASADDVQSRVADSGVKAMIPVGRPFLDYVISALADALITDICIVVGPGANPIRERYERDAPPSRVRLTFAVQEEPRGSANAILAVEEFAAGDHIVTLNSDNYYPVYTLRALRDLAVDHVAGVAAFERSELIRRSNVDEAKAAVYSIVSIDADGLLERIIEKPDAKQWEAAGTDVYIGMNSWSLPPEIFEASRRITPSPRGELELPAAVQYARDTMAVPFHVLEFRDGVMDLSTRADISAMESRMRDVEVQL